MCGGKELVKQDGVFVCQNCGTKYSVEEAKKIMVTIDNSAKSENALKNARRAMEDKNFQKAQEYYSIVQTEEPENWEANFYILYCEKFIPRGLLSIPSYSLNRFSIRNVLKDIKKLADNTQQNEAIKKISNNLLAWEELLDIFIEELFSEFGKNEFTISIKRQCDETLLRGNIQFYEDSLRKENDNITINKKGILSSLGVFNSEVEKSLEVAERYAAELIKISPTSYELTRFNEIKKSGRRFWIFCGISILLFLLFGSPK
jgi:tetratricopeptide (TPR) repeat protein